MAVPVIYNWEEHGLVDAGGVLKRDEFHGIAVLCKHCLARNQPSDGGDLFAHMAVEIPGAHIVSIFQDTAIKVEGMDRKEETQGLGFMLQHDVSGVWGLVLTLRVCFVGAGQNPARIFFKEGGLSRGVVLTEEAEGLPHKSGPVETPGDGVKAASLDENPHVLEMDMGTGSVQERVERDEKAIPRALVDDGLPGLLGKLF